MPVAVIYGADSKVPRVVIGSDTQAELDAAVSVSDGEAVEYFPDSDARTTADLPALLAELAKRIGEPKHSGRVVEIDGSGAVVALYAADPLIDKPRLDARNTLEVHDKAEVGDIKGQDGKYVSTKQPPVGPTPEELKRFLDGLKGGK